LASLITNGGSSLTTPLQEMLQADEIVPGAAPSYQLCKTIYNYHPLGKKLVDSPIMMAQSQKREISIPDGPEDRVKEAFAKEWERIGADKHIANTMRLARIYGIASLALLVEGEDNDKPLDLSKLSDKKISFNEFDPLNTAGSLVLNLQPNAMDFMKHTDIVVSGKRYHRSRSVVILNEDPIYLEYTTSAYGYVGRSSFQRALFPLKSFLQSLSTDDMVTRKAGVLIAKLQSPGSIIDNMMSKLFGQKRALIQESQTDNVISVGLEEAIETLNLQNLDGAYGQARKNILENIAAANDMPAKLLNSETFAEGFGEGTEDAKNVARYIDRVRVEMRPLYDFFDQIVMHRAWNEEFYKTIQADFPDYKKIPYSRAFYDWVNSFAAIWPNLLTEPDSEKIKVDETKLKAIISAVEVFAPMLDPDNKARMVQWAAENLNENKLLFQSPLELDIEDLKSFVPAQPLEEPSEPKPFAAQDSQRGSGRLRSLSERDSLNASQTGKVLSLSAPAK